MGSLVLAAGLFWGHWNPLVVVFGYFLETIVVGMVHVAKMSSVLRFGQAQRRAMQSGGISENAFTGLFGIVFFVVHYFFFVFVQSVFVFSFFSPAAFGFADGFKVFRNYALLLQRPDMQLVLGIVVATQLGAVVKNFYLPRKYDVYTLEQLFLQPYLRIFVQQVATILTGFIMLLLGAPMATAVLLIVVRLVVDCCLAAAKNNERLRMTLYKGILQKDGKADDENARKLLDVWLDQ